MKMFGFGGLMGMLLLAVGFAAYESQEAAGVIKLETQLVGKAVRGDAHAHDLPACSAAGVHACDVRPGGIRHESLRLSTCAKMEPSSPS